MPTKRNMKNYALVEVIQPKNYYELVKAKLCHNVEEIILSYVFYDSKRQTHACKLNINTNMEMLARTYQMKGVVNGVFVSRMGWFLKHMWEKTECAVCKKKFANIKLQTESYISEDLDALDQFDDEAEWIGDICSKCEKRYGLERLLYEDEATFTSLLHRLCKGKTQDERDEIFENSSDE